MGNSWPKARPIAAVGAGDFVVPVEGVLNEKHVPVEELQARVREVLSDPSYATNARRISENMQTYGGASEAARLVEGFIQSWETGSEERGSQRPNPHSARLGLQTTKPLSQPK